MGWGWPITCFILATLTTDIRGDITDHRWSRPATPERRQGDWVPLTCANCRSIGDQGVQASNSLPSVLTPPPRVEEARLLPPPPPPDGLFQTAASGFLQQFTQQQPPPRKPFQFLQETSAQSVNRPQAQFLKSNIPVSSKQSQQISQEHNSEFQPPQQPQHQQSNRQPQLLQFNQQYLPDNGPYLNQPILIGPQFLAAPFFPQTSIPPQNIQPISPVQIQPQNPIQPNAVPVNSQNFQIPSERPLFLQQITAAGQGPANEPQQITPQTPVLQQQYLANDTESKRDESEREEVQLLYVPVETLNQRSRNLGRLKSVSSNHHGVSSQQTGATELNRFTNPEKDYEFSTKKPHIEDQDNFNTQVNTPKNHYDIKQNVNYQQQLPPEDQEKYNSQIHSVREQLNANPQNRFQQQTGLQNAENFKLESQNLKQYNFKINDQYHHQLHQDQGNFNHQFNTQQPNVQFQEQLPLDGSESLKTQSQKLHQHQDTRSNNDQFHQNIQQDQANYNLNTLRSNNHLRPQLSNNFQHQSQNLNIGNFNPQTETKQQYFTQNQQLQQQLPINQQTPLAFKDQPYINQPIQLSSSQNQHHQQITAQQDQRLQFDFPESDQQTTSPVTQTREPDSYSIQNTKSPRFRAPQIESTRNVLQPQNNQFHTLQNYQQTTISSSTLSPEVNKFTSDKNVEQNNQQLWLTQNSQGQNQEKRTNVQQVDSIRNSQQPQNSEFRRFPQDYQQTAVHSSTLSPDVNVYSTEKVQNSGQNFQQSWHSQNIPDHHHIPNVATTSTIPPLQTTLAPNQPPLSVYMETTEDTKVNDVLRLLKNAKTIQVLDTIGPDSPQVFVGPSNLKAPAGYIKFELPYLNSLESNRVERKVDRLPFFVAPLNFNPPPGYSKIPFPAPHIGSVVVSNATVLKTALHEKPYENEPITISSSERYLDQFTLPAEIPSISPQLPSLVNSLQDEIYPGSSTTAFPSTTIEETTTAFTTPAYRGRGSSRGSQRGSSSYSNPTSATRRPQSRTRRPYDGRPYSRRKPVTTPTTSEPTTENPQQPEAMPQSEQLSFKSDPYTVQNTAAPGYVQTKNTQSSLVNTGPFYDERFTSNNFNPGSLVPQQEEGQLTENLNVPQEEVVVSTRNNNNQYYQNQGVTQNNFDGQTVSHITTVPPGTVSDTQLNEQSFKSQRTSSSRRESLRQHQRFRGRQRTSTSTTTEAYEDPKQPSPNQYQLQSDSDTNFHNFLNRQQLRNNDQHRLVENTHFEASTPLNKHIIQTERADIGLETTERVKHLQNENEHFIQHNTNNYHSPQTNSNYQHQQREFSTFNSPANQAGNPVQLQEAQLPQTNINFQNSNLNVSIPHNEYDYPQQTTQRNYISNQFQNPDSRIEITQYNSEQNIDKTKSVNQKFDQGPKSYFEETLQQGHEDDQPNIQGLNVGPSQQTHSVDQQIFYINQRQVTEPSNINQGFISQEFSSPKYFEHATEKTASLQETPVQVPHSEILPTQPQQGPEEVQQYNQPGLIKNNRDNDRTPNPVDSSINDDQFSNIRRGQYQFQSNIDNSDTSTTEAGTTKSSLVRVRGRVRNRQRGSSRNYQTTTTETPNYPTTYLNKQRNTQDTEENHEYTPRKRINYGNRGTLSLNRYNSNNNNKEVNADQSDTEINNFSSTEKQEVSERSTFNSHVTTTENSPTKPPRRYQHILNRNKLRRTRPTISPSTSGSSGTTKFLLPTTSPPITRLPSTRGRIRKPISIKSTSSTTEKPSISQNWNERENFAPSAGSNEILEPLYQTKDKTQTSFGFQRTPAAPISLLKTQPKTIAASSDDEDDYWKEPVTIQQSTSFDFKPDSSVTPPSFQANNEQLQGTPSPIWNGQIELQDGNYYDVFSQQQISKNINDQTPFSSDQQKVVFKEVKGRHTVGKDNQYTEKTFESGKSYATEEEETTQTERIYPVYQEIIKPVETIQEEASQSVGEVYDTEEKNIPVHEKNVKESEEKIKLKNISQEEIENIESESEIKEGAIKRKISATNSGKKGGRRRGSWVRVRVRKPQDMFETAESQNLASISENAIQAVTKPLNEKAVWSPEPSTQLPFTTTTETGDEPVETINFEEALKDMLKEFITNPSEQNKEDADNNMTIQRTNETVSKVIEETEQNEDEPQATKEDTDKFEIKNDSTQNEPESKHFYKGDTINQNEEQRTTLPEITTEIITQPTTLVQTIENAETTLEPEATTILTEQTDNNKQSRVLGTSTTTEISLETEICYRGRCVKTKKGERSSDLLTTE